MYFLELGLNVLNAVLFIGLLLILCTCQLELEYTRTITDFTIIELFLARWSIIGYTM